MPGPSSSAPRSSGSSSAKAGVGDARAARKELTKIEKRTQKLVAEQERLHAALADAATDHELVLGLDAELRAVLAEREQLEDRWLELAADLD